jgi:hypothetical protein
MHGMAVFTLCQGVMGSKLDPVFSLVGRKDAAPFAQGTYAVERRIDCGPNELRPIGYTTHGFQKGFISLEGDDFVFPLMIAHREASIWDTCL